MAGEVAFTEQKKASDSSGSCKVRRKLMPLGWLHGMEVHSVHERIKKLLERVEVGEAHGITSVRLDHPFATDHSRLLVA